MKNSTKSPRLFFYTPKNQFYEEDAHMAKTRQEKITSYEERIAQLENQKKLEEKRMRAEERKMRDRRLYKRAGLLESLLPDTEHLTDEQLNTFLRMTTANQFGKDKLAQLIADGEKTATMPKPSTAASAAEQSQAPNPNGNGGNPSTSQTPAGSGS